jgi:hypothetical protein
MKKTKSLLAAMLVILSIIFCAWTLTHQGDVPGGRHFMKKYWSIRHSQSMADQSFDQWMYRKLGLDTFNGLIRYQIHFEGEANSIKTLRGNLSNNWEQHYKQKSEPHRPGELAKWFYEKSQHSNNSIEMYLIPSFRKNKHSELADIESQILTLPNSPIPNNQKTYQNLATKLSWDISKNKTFNYQRYFRINRPQDIDLEISIKEGSVYFMRLKSMQGKPMIVYRESFSLDQETKKIKKVVRLEFPQKKEGLLRAPSSARVEWEQEMGFYGSIRSEGSNIPYFAKINHIVIDPETKNITDVGMGNIEIMGKGALAGPQEKDRYKLIVMKLVEAMKFGPLSEAFKLDSINHSL